MTIPLFVIAFLILVLAILSYLGFLKIALVLAVLILFFGFWSFVFFMIEGYRVIVYGNAPYVRSSKKIIKRILAEVKIPNYSIVYDLGCGDGRFLREIVKTTKVEAIGFEYFFIPYLLAKLFNLFSPNKIKVYCQDFFKADLSHADVIFCYLFDKEQERLEKKLQNELRPGAIVVSNTFKFKNWQPLKVVQMDGRGLSNKFLIYQR